MGISLVIGGGVGTAAKRLSGLARHRISKAEWACQALILTDWHSPYQKYEYIQYSFHF
jgi:hypothetical protein